MVLCVVSLLFATDINSICIEDSCDYIEINDFGRAGASRKQIIFWEWKKEGVANIQRKITGEPTGLIQYGAGFTVIEYRMIQSEMSPRGISPMVDHDYKNNRITVIFWDIRDKALRRMTAKWIIYTKSPDSEQANLEVWAKGSRRGLTRPLKSN